MSFNLPKSIVGLRLARITNKDELILCEAMRFNGGNGAVEMVLRRAGLSGRIEVEGEIANHFADALDDNGNTVVSIALDAGSYRALKTRWMRCKVESVKDSLRATRVKSVASVRAAEREKAANLCEIEAEACIRGIVPGDEIGRREANARADALLTAAADIRANR